MNFTFPFENGTKRVEIDLGNDVIRCYSWCGRRDSNSQHSDSKSFRVGIQGHPATNKDNKINMIKGLIYSGVPSNMACFCKLMAQNWHKSFPSLYPLIIL
jgi:hypothetical protein